MNDRYIDHGDSSNFPEEAFNMDFDADGPVEFHDSWLSSASEEDQMTAMRDWFGDRYCDPAHETPYNGREGGYLFINGGPYSPSEELNERFGECIPQELIDEVSAEFENELGDEWAPIRYQRDDDYDDYFSIEIVGRTEPKSNLVTRIYSLDETLTSTNSQENLIVLHMSYGMLISYFEAYLSETVIFWAKEDDSVLFRIAVKEFENKKYSLSEIFDDIDKFKEKILNHLVSNVVWHRLDKLKPTLEHGLKIVLPDIASIMGALKNRHDIAHRGGFNKDGEMLRLKLSDIEYLKSQILLFVEEFETALSNSFPVGEVDDSPF